MTKPKRLDELLALIYDGSEAVVDVEYMGQFLVNGIFTLRVPEDSLRHQWGESIVPNDYFPIYGLKCDRPEMAGGLFDGAPFVRFDATDAQNEWLNLPPPPEDLFELCTDNCGAQFWIGQSLTVFGHNLDNEFQAVGPLSDFAEFAIEMTLQEKNWHQCLSDSEFVEAFRLATIEMMG